MRLIHNESQVGGITFAQRLQTRISQLAQPVYLLCRLARFPPFPAVQHRPDRRDSFPCTAFHT